MEKITLNYRIIIEPETKKHTTVAFHPGTFPQGTLRGIISQTGMTTDELLTYRKRKK